MYISNPMETIHLTRSSLININWPLDVIRFTPLWKSFTNSCIHHKLYWSRPQLWLGVKAVHKDWYNQSQWAEITSSEWQGLQILWHQHCLVWLTSQVVQVSSSMPLSLPIHQLTSLTSTQQIEMDRHLWISLMDAKFSSLVWLWWWWCKGMVWLPFKNQVITQTIQHQTWDLQGHYETHQDRFSQ